MSVLKVLIWLLAVGVGFGSAIVALAICLKGEPGGVIVGAVLAIVCTVFGMACWRGLRRELRLLRELRERQGDTELPDQQDAAGTGHGSAKGAPAWFLPAGIVSVILGILGFLASAAIGGPQLGGTFAATILAGLLNPFFFIGFPLGIYWLYRVGKPGSRQPTTYPSEEANPKLTHCPDCGRHVSRLATSCPHCGRPLSPENSVS